MKKLLLSFLITLNFLFVQAASLSEQEAYQIAQKYHKELSKIPWEKSTTLHKSLHSNNPEYYIFNAGNNKGFIIITGENDLTEVIGYSDSGNIDIENIPENLASWLNDYAKYVDNVRQYKALPEKKYNHIYEPVVSPLLGKIAWEQSAPFNAKCPYDETAEAHCATGCTATAISQIMKYWEWPLNGSGNHSYTTNYGVLSADFSKTYRWDLIKETYNTYWDAQFNLIQDWTPEEEDAVSQLLYDVGVSCETDYSPSESGGNTIILKETLNKNFHYNISSISRSSWPTKRWIDLLKAELNVQHPLFIVSAYITYSGGGLPHAFVIDGYDTAGYFHINWGWGPNSVNGYFNINYLNASEYLYGGANGDNRAYTWNQNVWILIPSKKEELQPVQQVLRFMFSDQALSVSKNTFPKSDPFPLNINQLWSDNYNIYNGELRVCIEDSTEKVIASSLLPYYIENLVRDDVISTDLTKYVPDLSSFEDGNYMLYLQSREINGNYNFNWIPLEYTNQIYFNISNDTITIQPRDDYSQTLTASINCNNIANYNSEFKVACTIKNYGNAEADGFIKLDIFNATDNSLIETLENRAVIYDHAEAIHNFNINISEKYQIGEKFYTKLSFRKENSSTIWEFNTDNATATFQIHEEIRNQTPLTFYSFTEYAGILLSQNKFFTTDLLNIVVKNMYNMNPIGSNFDIAIGLFNLKGDELAIGKNSQLHFNNYEHHTESIQSPDLSSLDDGNYYFEPLSKEIYQDINYDWIFFDIQSRLFFKKIGYSGYQYDPQNVIDAYTIFTDSTSEVGENLEVKFSLKNMSFNDANGSLSYHIYNEKDPYKILLSDNMEIAIPHDSYQEFQKTISLSPSLFKTGENYIFELSEYTDYEDQEKTFAGNNIKFRATGIDGIHNVSSSTEIYPNPVTNYLIINTEAPIHVSKIYNSNSNLLIETNGNNSNHMTIDVQHLPNGFYFIAISTAKGFEIHKFIIRK